MDEPPSSPQPPPSEQEEEEEPPATPLLFLLDGCLSRDEARVQEALQEIHQLLGGGRPVSSSHPTTTTPPASSFCDTPAALCQVLQALLAVRPEFCRMRSAHDGSLPLHFAASLGNVPAADILWKQYPQAASTANHKGKIPLHYAAREGRIEMVHFFLQRAPETARIATDKGKLAVHFAVGEGHAAIASALLWQYPQSAAIPSNPKGKLPLHFGARWGYLNIAHELLGIYPDAVRALDWEGSLPLHDAAREGQYRMARYLLERFPVALQTANLRGEIPLFPAVRSANVDLVCLLIQAWPAGGKHILRNVSADDNVTSWNPEILELLLRGAVNNLHGCHVLEGREPPTVQLTDDIEPTAVVASPKEVAKQKKKKAKKSAASKQPQPQPQPRLVQAPVRWLPHDAGSAAPFFPAPQPPPAVAAMPVRCKSPLLISSTNSSGLTSDAAGVRTLLDGKKHGRKRSRQLSFSDDDDDEEEESKIASSDKPRVFLPLHAAFESKSSPHVIRHVLAKHVDNVTQIDERGRLPLHWAVAHCHRQNAVVQLLLSKDNDILTPEAAHVRDREGRLPLHAAIAAQADVRVIKALLAAHPEAGVQASGNRFHHQTPVQMATQYNCDVSTVFELLRVDPSFVDEQIEKARGKVVVV